MTTLTLIYNPNRCDTEVHIHAAGCRDIGKDARGATTVYTAEFENADAALIDFYGDFIGEGSMTEDDALGYGRALPCVVGR